MAIPRRQIVDTTVTRWYHCISRCVRGARVLGERKDWIQARLEALAGIYAIAVGVFSIMENHLHIVLRIDEDVAREDSQQGQRLYWLAGHGWLCPLRWLVTVILVAFVVTMIAGWF